MKPLTLRLYRNASKCRTSCTHRLYGPRMRVRLYLPHRIAYLSGVNTSSRFLRTDDLDLARTVTVGLQKGGTSKTTVTALIGYEAARLGAKVLLIDFDPNAVLTKTMLGYQPKSADTTVDELLTECTDGGAFDALMQPPEAWRLRDDLAWDDGGTHAGGGGMAFIPGYPTLQPAVDMTNAPAAERRLRRSLRGVAGQFDLVLIDTGPRADKIAQTALLASGTAIAPVTPGAGSTGGLENQLGFLDQFASAWEHPIRFGGALVTRFDNRNRKTHGRGLEDLQRAMRERRTDYPDISGTTVLSGPEPYSFAGEAGGVWEEILWESSFVEQANSAHAPVASLLIPSNGAAPWYRKKEKDRLLPKVTGYTRNALRLLQLTESPALARIGAHLETNPIPGIWPPAGESDEPSVAATEG